MADDIDRNEPDEDFEDEIPDDEEGEGEGEEDGESVPSGNPKDIERTQDEGGEEPAEEDEDASFSVQVADSGPCEKTVTVEIPAETVDREIAKNMDNIKTSVPVRGFRKGRIPKGLLVRRFGTKVKDEVRSNLVSRGVLKALKRDDVKSIAFPDVDESKIALDEGKPMKFEFVVDVRPDIVLGEYVGIEVEKPPTSVDEKDIDDHIEGLRKELSTLEPVADGPAQAGDRLVATFRYSLNNKTILTKENVSLPMPEDPEAPAYKTAPWISTLLGKKQGETVETEYKFPDDFPVKKARARTGRMEVKVEDVKRIRLPSLDEEFLKTLKVADVAELRKKVGENLKSIKESAAGMIVEKRVMQKLIDSVRMDLPERVIDRSLDSQTGKAELKLKQAGLPDEEIKTRIENVRKGRREDLVREFKSLFVIEEIARKEKIYVTEEEVSARIELIAHKYGKWPQQVESELEEKGLLDDLRANLREEKVLSFLREKAKIVEGSGPAPSGGGEGQQGA